MVDVIEDVKDVKSDIKEVKLAQAKGFEDLNQKLDDFITASNDKFLTVAQAKLIGWVVGFLLTVTTIAIAVLNYLKH